ncbi:MAG: TrbG/VirB9 family P-type conjugative transfer protein [Pseudomonadota bacterium]
MSVIRPLSRLFAVMTMFAFAPLHATDLPPAARTAITSTPVPAPQMSMPAAPVSPHIRYVDYHRDRVVGIVGYTGYQIMVEFAPGETIETVGLGDSTGWQVTPNGAATVLFIKPLGLPERTNMAIVTDQRRYNFELIARSGKTLDPGEAVYAMRFRYDDEPDEVGEAEEEADPGIAAIAVAANRDYSYEGAAANVPEEVFDDGRATYFRFAEGRSRPAIFTITGDSGESIVNSAIRDGYVIIPEVAPEFMLRQGEYVTKIYNEAYINAEPGELAPRKRPKRKRGLFASIFGGSGEPK